MAIVGVDEAGKGPAIGSMFAAAVRAPDADDLAADLRDSKQLSAGRRESLAASIRSTDGVAVACVEVPVERIDDPATDMNRLTVAAHADAIAAVATEGDSIRCDAADVDADRFGRRVADAVRSAGREGVAVEAAHRADERGGVVSAAGIVAKVVRDAHVDELSADYGPIGSGYPSDPTTQRFLRGYVRTHGELPACARRSWATSRRLLAAEEQADIGEY